MPSSVLLITLLLVCLKSIKLHGVPLPPVNIRSLSLRKPKQTTNVCSRVTTSLGNNPSASLAVFLSWHWQRAWGCRCPAGRAVCGEPASGKKRSGSKGLRHGRVHGPDSPFSGILDFGGCWVISIFSYWLVPLSLLI